MILTREFRKENGRYIEQWNVLKKFSCSLSVVLLSLSLLFYFLIAWFTCWVLLTGIFFFIITMLQSLRYDRWAFIDLDNCVGLLKLEEQTLKQD